MNTCTTSLGQDFQTCFPAFFPIAARMCRFKPNGMNINLMTVFNKGGCRSVLHRKFNIMKIMVTSQLFSPQLITDHLISLTVLGNCTQLNVSDGLQGKLQKPFIVQLGCYS